MEKRGEYGVRTEKDTGRVNRGRLHFRQQVSESGKGESDADESGKYKRTQTLPGNCWTLTSISDS